MSQIFDLRKVKTNDIVQVTQKGRTPTFCVVKHISSMKGVKKFPPWISDKVQKIIKVTDCQVLEMVEFNKEISEWQMTVPTTTGNSFVSLNDPAWNFTLHTSSFEEVKIFLEKSAGKEFTQLLKETLSALPKIEQEYSTRIGRVAEKLLK